MATVKLNPLSTAELRELAAAIDQELSQREREVVKSTARQMKGKRSINAIYSSGCGYARLSPTSPLETLNERINRPIVNPKTSQRIARVLATSRPCLGKLRPEFKGVWRIARIGAFDVQPLE